jgi:hypothetical protein
MDQDKNLRQQMMQYYAGHLNSSLWGRWEILRDRLTSGTLPPDVLQNMMQGVQAMRALTNSEISKRRAAALEQSAYPNTLDVRLGPQTQGEYDINSPTAPGATPAAPAAAATPAPAAKPAAKTKTNPGAFDVDASIARARAAAKAKVRGN